MTGLKATKNVDVDVALRMREVRQRVRNSDIELPPPTVETKSIMRSVTTGGFAADHRGETDKSGVEASDRALLNAIEALSERVREVNQNRRLQEFEFPSGIPLFGGLISAFRRIWNTISTRWYVKFALDQQMEYNDGISQVLSDVTQVLFAVDRQVRTLTTSVDSLKRDHRILQDQQTRTIGETDTSIANLRAELTALGINITNEAQEVRSLRRLSIEQTSDTRVIRDTIARLRAEVASLSVNQETTRETVGKHGESLHQHALDLLMLRSVDEAFERDLAGKERNLQDFSDQLRENREAQREVQRAYLGLVMALAQKMGDPGPPGETNLIDPNRRLISTGAPLEYFVLSRELGETGSATQQRYERYLDYFAGCIDVLDIGCGDGSFLALLRDRGIDGRGVDRDEHLVRVCQGRGLEAVCADGIEYLAGLADGSLDGIFLGHVIEVFSLEQKFLLLKLCAAKLRRDRYLVLETPNIGSFSELCGDYFRDPYHAMPMHPSTYRLLTLTAGFRFATEQLDCPVQTDRQLRMLNDSGKDDQTTILNENFRRLNNLLFGFHNAAIIAQK